MDDNSKYRSECVTPDQLVEFLQGSVLEPKLSELAVHLDQCETCQAIARKLTVDDTIVEALRTKHPEDEVIASRISAGLIRTAKQIPQLESRLGLQGSESGVAAGLNVLDDVTGFLDPPQHAGDLGQLGRYRVLELLGRGGMGAVFRAIDPKLGRQMALKIMLPRLASIPAARDRFLREAKAAASLKNDHIVTIYQVDEINGVPFLAMELLHGESLEQALLAGRRFSVAETLSIARDVALGLAEAHEKGMVHRDIKPGNLWLEKLPEGSMRLKILDFGLARAQGDDVQITEYGRIVGTPAFMAPEQARADREVDARADLFSLGCVLYVLCTGEIPFKADTTVGTLMALAMNQPIAPDQRNESVPSQLSSLVMKLLEKSPADRPQSAFKVVHQLRQLEQAPNAVSTEPGALSEIRLGDSKPLSASASQPAHASHSVRQRIGRRHSIVAVVVIAALALVAAGIFLWPTPDGRVLRIESNDSPIQSDQYDQLLTAMRKANPGFDGAMIPGFENGRLVSLEFKTDNVTDLSPLRELKYLRSLRMVGNYSLNAGISDLSPLNGLSLTSLYIYNSPRVTDLSPLKGMQLQELHTDGCTIADFAALAGMPLRVIHAWSWTGSDLSPLKGMPLTELNIGGNGQPMDLAPLTGAPLTFLCFNASDVSDITPLKGMPLKRLYFENTLVSDLSPIAGAQLEEFIAGGSQVDDFTLLRDMPLTWAKFDIVPDRDLEVLRDIKSLVRINDQRASDFLREFDDKGRSQAVKPVFINSIGMQFVQIPKGKAWLARKVAEEETTGNHETIIAEDFYLGMYEVTQEEWRKVMGTNPSWFTRGADGADAVKSLPDHLLKKLPVERVSWTACQEFIAKLNELDSDPGWVYRLPTEAQWQYACRGGPMNEPSAGKFEYLTTTATNTLTPDDANIQHALCWNRPCRVGLFAPNKLGLYDMHGNVWEWCHDAPSWRNPPSRFIHGGGWNDTSERCHASDILQPTEPWTYYDLGLRVARVPAK